ncbi:enolase C-terminal domain-like protein [Acidisphaera sp. S103]|uniref:enolase C-terminal domain-like protein n=1 Tax=Acidisphaera sp. S103 TaxID=1747223 RepID=UPI00131CE440|nr:enolase C-terminal domain-like protein [Acidisphaera sp. S103]
MQDTPIPNKLTLRDISCRAVRVPLVFTLGTSAAIVRAVPLLLVDLSTEDGPAGRTYLFCYTNSGARAIAEHIREAADLVRGMALSPLAQTQFLQRRYALLGVTGTVRMALSAIDMAFWDAHARSIGQPLAHLLGGGARPLPAYDSRGLGLMAPPALADEAEKMLALGLKALKLRLGYPTLAEDLAALDAVRNRVGTGISIMVDYNQALSPAEALKRGRALDTHDIVWLEEPMAHEDYRSYARLTHALTTPIQIGENFNGPAGLSQALAAGACDLVMPDVARIGGVTGWMQASGIAAAAGIEMSSHLMPEISAQLLCATPSAHWLEYVDWANAFLKEPMRIVDGMAILSDRPGAGLDWDEARLQRLETL